MGKGASAIGSWSGAESGTIEDNCFEDELMAIALEGYVVVVKYAAIAQLLEERCVEIPNVNSLHDGDLWCCSFMNSHDCATFVGELHQLGLNTTDGPDSDVVVVNEFDKSVTPYCEWLEIGPFDKGTIAWLAGTQPESVVAPNGWDPAEGSRLQYGRPEDLEFVRLDGNVEVYRDTNTGQELYIGRTTVPVDALYQEACDVIMRHFVNPGDPQLYGDVAKAVEEAKEKLDIVISEAPESYGAFWFKGKALFGLGELEASYEAFQQAYEIEKSVDSIPREIGAVCMQMCKFEEAVAALEATAILVPDNVEVLGNLACAYLLAGDHEKAKKSVNSAMKIDRTDVVNAMLSMAIDEVMMGSRPQPKTLDELQGAPPQQPVEAESGLASINKEKAIKSIAEAKGKRDNVAPDQQQKSKKKRSWLEWLGFSKKNDRF